MERESFLINALAAMTAAFAGTAIGLFFFWGLSYDALDLAREASDITRQAEQRAEKAEYELRRAQEEYERDTAGLVNDLWTCQDRNLDLQAHCPLYASP